jgi:hypothetical protein
VSWTVSRNELHELIPTSVGEEKIASIGKGLFILVGVDRSECDQSSALWSIQLDSR